LLPRLSGLGPEKEIISPATLTVVKVEYSTKPSRPIRHSSRLRSVKDSIATMPSFLRNSRSFSFPPFVDSDDLSSGSGLPDIDEDPFSHFLTPINEEDDPYDGLSMSAGIAVPEGPRTSKAAKFKSTVSQKWARYVQHHHSNLHTIYHDAKDEDEEEEESFMQLDDHRLVDTPHMVFQLSAPPSPSTSTPVLEPTRGRAQELLSPQSRGRPRHSRTLSGRRHAWREPSPDLFTVMEAEEVESSAKVRPKTKDGAEHRRSHVDVVEKIGYGHSAG
jgi:hypothetical protein